MKFDTTHPTRPHHPFRVVGNSPSPDESGRRLVTCASGARAALPGLFLFERTASIGSLVTFESPPLRWLFPRDREIYRSGRRRSSGAAVSWSLLQWPPRRFQLIKCRRPSPAPARLGGGVSVGRSGRQGFRGSYPAPLDWPYAPLPGSPGKGAGDLKGEQPPPPAPLSGRGNLPLARPRTSSLPLGLWRPGFLGQMKTAPGCWAAVGRCVCSSPRRSGVEKNTRRTNALSSLAALSESTRPPLGLSRHAVEAEHSPRSRVAALTAWAGRGIRLVRAARDKAAITRPPVLPGKTQHCLNVEPQAL